MKTIVEKANAASVANPLPQYFRDKAYAISAVCVTKSYFINPHVPISFSPLLIQFQEVLLALHYIAPQSLLHSYMCHITIDEHPIQ